MVVEGAGGAGGDAELARVQWQGDLAATVMRDFVRTV